MSIPTSGDGHSTERASEVRANSNSDAAEQEVIRELNKINHDDIDGVSGSQISTGDLSQPAQCSDEIDAAQMSKTQPQQLRKSSRRTSADTQKGRRFRSTEKSEYDDLADAAVSRRTAGQDDPEFKC